MISLAHVRHHHPPQSLLFMSRWRIPGATSNLQAQWLVVAASIDPPSVNPDTRFFDQLAHASDVGFDVCRMRFR